MAADEAVSIVKGISYGNNIASAQWEPAIEPSIAKLKEVLQKAFFQGLLEKQETCGRLVDRSLPYLYTFA